MKKSRQGRQRAWTWRVAVGVGQVENSSAARIPDWLMVGRLHVGTRVLAGVPGGTGVPG